MKMLIALLLTCILCAAARAGEMRPGHDDGGAALAVEGPAVKPLDARLTEKLRKLIDQLADEDFDKRNTASNQILEMGERAWPLLEPHLQDEDAERVQRVRDLAAHLAVVRPDQEVLLKELVERLEGADDLKRAEGLDGILNLGLPGFRLLRQHLAGQNAMPTLRLDFEHNVVTVGEKIFARGTLINEGQGPMWRKNGYNSMLSFRCYGARAFGEERPYGTFGRCFGCGRRIICRRAGYFNPIRDYTCIKPGAVVVSSEFEQELDATGIYNAILSTSIPENAIISPRMPGSETTVDLLIGAGIGKDKMSPTLSTPVYALPKSDAPAQDDFLAMTLNAAQNPVAGKTLNARVSLASHWTDSTLRLEQNLARYAWYAILDNGVPVKWGSLESVLVAQNAAHDDLLATRDLDAGQSADFALAIPMPEQPGVYTLLTGYERIRLPLYWEPESPFARENDPATDVLPYVPYDSGKLYSSLELHVK